MRPWILVVCFVLLNPTDPVLAGEPVVDLGWNACAPITRSLPSIAPGTPEVSLWVSAIGLQQPIRAYQFQILYGIPGERRVPDAWRFDWLACQSSTQIRIDHLVTKTCPPLMPGHLPAQQIKIVQPNGTTIPYFEPDLMLITMYNAYSDPEAHSPTTDPGMRYFLGRIRFDHTYSVNGATTPAESCGGLEHPMCFTLLTKNYVTLGGDTLPFGYGSGWSASVGMPANCGQTPAKNATWGQIKSLYRM